jgi:hypothetical protein
MAINEIYNYYHKFNDDGFNILRYMKVVSQLDYMDKGGRQMESSPLTEGRAVKYISAETFLKVLDETQDQLGMYLFQGRQ